MTFTLIERQKLGPNAYRVNQWWNAGDDQDALTRVAYVNGWLAADVEQHAAGIGSTVITRQALALFRANQYMNMLAVSRIEVAE